MSNWFFPAKKALDERWEVVRERVAFLFFVTLSPLHLSQLQLTRYSSFVFFFVHCDYMFGNIWKKVLVTRDKHGRIRAQIISVQYRAEIISVQIWTEIISVHIWTEIISAHGYCRNS